MELDRTYSALIEIPQYIQEMMKRDQLETLCRQALEKARLEEPIRTGNLRRSTNFSIHKDYIEFYINPAYFVKTGPYYEYLDDNNTRAAGYFERATAKFTEIITDAFNSFYAMMLRAEADPTSALAKIYLAAWTLFKKRQKEKEEKKKNGTTIQGR